MQKYKTLSNGIIFAELDGTKGHYELGLQHGRLLREKILDCIHYVRSWYCEELGQDGGEKLIHKLQYETAYLSDAKAFLPEIYDELRGIADGCGIPVEEAFLINCLDEGFYLMLDQKQDKIPSGKCTCLGLKKTESLPCRMAQNLDFSTAYNGFQTLFKIHESDRDILIYSFCGQLMGMGVNSKGISVIANAIVNGTVSLEHGVSNTLMQRAFYECNNTDECETLLRKCPRATSTAYTVSDFNTIRCFEATVNGVAEVQIPNNAPGIAHTNHLLVSQDTRNMDGACFGSKILKTPDGVSWEMTEERLEIARQFVAQNGNNATEDMLMSFLTTPPILRNYGDPTIQSFVAIIDRDNPCIYVAGGDDKREFVKVSLFS